MATIVRRGDRQWQARVRRRGIRASATFETKARAAAWARQAEVEIDAGRFQRSGSAEAERTSLNEAFDRYLAEVVPSKKGIVQTTGIVRAWQRTELARRPLAVIRGTDIATWRDAKLKEVGPQTVVHHLNVLSHLYRVAATDWGLESLNNPVSKIKKPPLPRGRERRLEPAEEILLLDACDRSQSTWLGSLVRLALATAMRQGELVSLTWSQVKLAQRTIFLRETKNGSVRTVPLSTEALKILGSMSFEDDGQLFKIRTGRAVTHAFGKACQRAGLKQNGFCCPCCRNRRHHQTRCIMRL